MSFTQLFSLVVLRPYMSVILFQNLAINYEPMLTIILKGWGIFHYFHLLANWCMSKITKIHCNPETLGRQKSHRIWVWYPVVYLKRCAWPGLFTLCLRPSLCCLSCLCIRPMYTFSQHFVETLDAYQEMHVHLKINEVFVWKWKFWSHSRLTPKLRTKCH